MSAYDLLSDDAREQLHRQWAAERARFAKLARTVVADPAFIDQLAVIAMVALPVPQRDNVGLLGQMKEHFRKHLDQMAAAATGQSDV